MATTITKDLPLDSVCLTLEGIKSMWIELNKLVAEQGEIELGQLERSPDQSPEEFEEYKNEARKNIFKILGTVEFENNNAYHDDNPEIVKISSDGSKVRFVYLSNITPYQRRLGVRPEHSFEVVFDLKNPPLFDTSNVVSAPTDNGSRISISGNRDGWRGGVEAVVRRNIYRRRPLRSFLHGAFVYDLFLMLIGLPLALYACWLAGPTIGRWFGDTNGIVVSAAYIYLALCVIWVYRFMFSYAKWAFPLVEIVDQPSAAAKHRALWWAFMVAIFTRPLWSIFSEVVKKVLFASS